MCYIRIFETYQKLKVHNLFKKLFTFGKHLQNR